MESGETVRQYNGHQKGNEPSATATKIKKKSAVYILHAHAAFFLFCLFYFVAYSGRVLRSARWCWLDSLENFVPRVKYVSNRFQRAVLGVASWSADLQHE